MALNINLDYSFIIFQTNKWIFNILAIILVYLIEHLLLSFLLNNGRIGLWTDNRSILLLFQYLLFILLLDEVILGKSLLNNVFLLYIKTCFLGDSDQFSRFLWAWANSFECLIYLEEYVFIYWHVVVYTFCRLGLVWRLLALRLLITLSELHLMWRYIMLINQIFWKMIDELIRLLIRSR